MNNERITASTLFAGREHRTGIYRCYYCDANCDETHKTKDFVKADFTNRDIVKVPNSDYVCIGCALSLGGGNGDMPMIDGSVKAFTTSRGMAPRMYSWLLADGLKKAFTKAHVGIIREMLLNPELLPEPPFAAIIADSGQKQLIFRAVVAHSKEYFPILLEDKEILVSPEELRKRIELTTPIVAAIGKPALLGTLGASAYITYQKHHGDIKKLVAWEKIKKEPLSQLAAWLAKNKEEAQIEFPNISGKIQTKISGA
ncbi:hypothetical protein FACS1894105_10450 [Clostridia bacterium]|nr:hypothetical protein FACS1894105_10450 [Clostridia bacterium]